MPHATLMNIAEKKLPHNQIPTSSKQPESLVKSTVTFDNEYSHDFFIIVISRLYPISETSRPI